MKHKKHEKTGRDLHHCSLPSFTGLQGKNTYKTKIGEDKKKQ